jgi:hypothetical protein
MASREKLLQAIDQIPEPLLTEVLHYLEYLLDRHLEEQEDEEDLKDLAAIRAEVAREGTVSWRQVKQELGL